MDALKKERLAAAGIDVDGALERFMGNDALLERFLKKFLADGNYAALPPPWRPGIRPRP